MGFSVANYILLLKSLLPRGSAWSQNVGAMPDLLAGIAEEFARADTLAVSLFDERDSRYTSALLKEQENDLGIVPEAGATKAERRSIVRSVLIAMGGQNAQYFIDLALAMGYVITIDQFTPAWCGIMVSGDPCGDQDVIFVWRVNLIYDADYADPTGADLEVVLERLKPAHTELIFRIVSVDFSNAFSQLDFSALPPKTGGDFNKRDFNWDDFYVNHAGDFERIDFDDDDFKLYR